MMASLRASAYLDKLFKDLKIQFKTGSRKEIEESFAKAKMLKPESDLFSQYIDS